MRVELRVVTNKPREYVLVEDPIPAGFEILPSEDELAPGKSEAKIVDPNCDCKNITLDPPPGWNRFPNRAPRRSRRPHRLFQFVFERRTNEDARPIPDSLHSETGKRGFAFAALPTSIEAMYAPDINGRSAQTVVDVK